MCPPFFFGEKIKSSYSESFLGKCDRIVYLGAAISGIDASGLFDASKDSGNGNLSRTDLSVVKTKTYFRRGFSP